MSRERFSESGARVAFDCSGCFASRYRQTRKIEQSSPVRLLRGGVPARVLIIHCCPWRVLLSIGQGGCGLEASAPLQGKDLWAEDAAVGDKSSSSIVHSSSLYILKSDAASPFPNALNPAQYKAYPRYEARSKHVRTCPDPPLFPLANHGTNTRVSFLVQVLPRSAHRTSSSYSSSSQTGISSCTISIPCID